jgi:Uma2 family endonuclease
MIDFYLRGYVMSNDLGEVHVELGVYPADDRSTLLAPDVAFVSHARLRGQPEDGFLPTMPDIAVEIVSPSNSLRQIRRKAHIYLDNGANLVWIVRPSEKGIDVCRATDGSRLDIEFVARDGFLSGEAALPGFELELRRLFPPSIDS